jgi:hypothetical protein
VACVTGRSTVTAQRLQIQLDGLWPSRTCAASRLCLDQAPLGQSGSAAIKIQLALEPNNYHDWPKAPLWKIGEIPLELLSISNPFTHRLENTFGPSPAFK